MADKSILIVVIIAIAAIGGFFLMKKKGKGYSVLDPATGLPTDMSSPNTETCIAELGPKPPAPGGTEYLIKLQACLEKKGGILGGVGGNSTKFWSSLPLPGAGTTLAVPKGGALSSINPQKVGTPITGGINFENAGAFSPLEAGNCQCDDRKCYYYAPFYAKYGEQAGYGPARKSTAVLWGDKVSACERLVAEHEMESYKFDQASSRMAYAMRSPNAARLARVRMARTGLVQ